MAVVRYRVAHALMRAASPLLGTPPRFARPGELRSPALPRVAARQAGVPAPRVTTPNEAAR